MLWRTSVLNWIRSNLFSIVLLVLNGTSHIVSIKKRPCASKVVIQHWSWSCTLFAFPNRYLLIQLILALTLLTAGLCYYTTKTLEFVGIRNELLTYCIFLLSGKGGWVLIADLCIWVIARAFIPYFFRWSFARHSSPLVILTAPSCFLSIFINFIISHCNFNFNFCWLWRGRRLVTKHTYFRQVGRNWL